MADQPLLQTTIAGSLPKPSWLAEPEKLWAPWRLEGDALKAGQRDATLIWLKEQEDAGIDIVTDVSSNGSRASTGPGRRRWGSATTATKPRCRR